MTNRVIGTSAMLGFGLGAIKEQFNSPTSNSKSNNDNSNGGFKGFIDRAKSVISPSMNLSDEKDYNGNVNPIRNVIPKEKQNTNVSIPTSNKTNSINSKNTPKSVVGKVAKTGFNATKAYLSVGARMVEGDFSKSPYKNNNKVKKHNFQSTEYINQFSNNENIKKLGDKNETEG